MDTILRGEVSTRPIPGVLPGNPETIQKWGSWEITEVLQPKLFSKQEFIPWICKRLG
jgi:hypothetical protein